MFRTRDSRCCLLSAERNPDRNYPQISLFLMFWGHPVYRGLWGALRTPLTWCKVAPLHLLRHHGATDTSLRWHTNWLLYRRHKLWNNLCALLGAVAKLRKATVSFVISALRSVRPSARNNSAFTGRIFMKFRIWRFGENLKKTEVSLESDKNSRRSVLRPMRIYDASLYYS